MTTSHAPPNTPTHLSLEEREDLCLELAAQLLLAAKASIPHGSIDPLKLWPRLKDALLSASSRAETYPQLASLVAKKIQVETYRKASGKWISSIGQRVADEAGWEAFRAVCEEMPEMVVVTAQLMAESGEDARARALSGVTPAVDALGLYEVPDDLPIEALAHHQGERITALTIHVERLTAALKTAEIDNAALREALKRGA